MGLRTVGGRITTVSDTLDPYWHAIPAMQEEAAALIAALVFANGQRPVPGAGLCPSGAATSP